MAWNRIETSSNPEQRLQGTSDGLDLILVAVSVSGVLAMVATWLLVAYYPIPDDEAVYLGLLGFFFVVSLDVFLIYHRVGSEVRQGQGIAAVKTSVSLILLGLLVASVVGSLPWLLSRLLAALPWVQEIPLSKLLILWLVAYDLWGRSKQTEDGHKHSWKWLIFQGSLLILFSMSTLLSAFSGFSDGKAWLGALYLAIALLFGLLAVYVFIEILRAWRRRREDAAREHLAGPPD
ncbi:MAG: hypothetical protein QOH06_1155 [Acidobacteriota bacterium]|jgi:hypothetical protein|nr:hypothetical protein [Acidobacteriota bacterium]